MGKCRQFLRFYGNENILGTGPNLGIYCNFPLNFLNCQRSIDAGLIKRPQRKIFVITHMYHIYVQCQ